MLAREILISALERSNNVQEGLPINPTDMSRALGYLKSALKRYGNIHLVCPFKKAKAFTITNATFTIGRPRFAKGIRVEIVGDTSYMPVCSGYQYEVDLVYCKQEAKFYTPNSDEDEWVEADLADFCDMVPDFVVMDCTEVLKLTYKDGERYLGLDFECGENFDALDNSSYVYTSEKIGTDLHEVYLKSNMVGKEIKVWYNESVEISEATDLNLPTECEELLKVSVTKHLVDADDEKSDAFSVKLEKEELSLKNSILAKNAGRRDIIQREAEPRETVSNGLFISRHFR